MRKVLDYMSELKSQETYERILEAAERLFRHFGYSKTNVADIARDLGMSSANIYRFFPSKAAIHQCLCERMLERIIHAVENVRDRPLPAETRLAMFASTMHELIVEMTLHDQKVHEMVVVALDAQWPVIDRYRDSIDAILCDIIADGVQEGVFHVQNAHLAAQCCCASLVEFCHPQLVVHNLGRADRPKLEDLLGFALRALKAPQ